MIETASRVRLAFAAGCPEADLFRSLRAFSSALNDGKKATALPLAFLAT